ncbi:MAG: hypothetical protein ACK481_02515 [Candidatus Melainabacteria bacterium]|jgi:putative transposase
MSQIIDKYCQLAISSTSNFTITYFSERIEVSHDSINRELRKIKLTPRRIRKRSGEENILIIDDTVLDKRHSRNIECANYLWDNCEKKY